MNQSTLFDPPKKCVSCGATTKADCGFDRDASEGIITGPRPRGCLNSAQNRDGVPY